MWKLMEKDEVNEKRDNLWIPIWITSVMFQYEAKLVIGVRIQWEKERKNVVLKLFLKVTSMQSRISAQQNWYLQIK